MSEKNIPMNVRFWSNKDQIAAFVRLYNNNIAPCLHFDLVPALIYSEKSWVVSLGPYYIILRHGKFEFCKYIDKSSF